MRALIALVVLIPAFASVGQMASAQQPRSARQSPSAQQAAPAPQAPSAPQQQRSPESLALALQQRYERVRDFTADFTQTYRSKLRTMTTERGKVAIKKPGRMRWTYSDAKEFVSDGTKLYTYFPDDKRVIVNDVPPDNEVSTGAMFLAGKGNVSRDFTAAHASATSKGAVGLKLTPRREQPDYEYLVVEIDPASLQILALRSVDHLGGESTLSFANLKENRGLSDKEFEFRPPRGARIASNGTPN